MEDVREIYKRIWRRNFITPMCRKFWKNMTLITIPYIRRWKCQWSSDSIARSKTNVMFTLNGNYKWIDELPRLVSDYNARKHRTVDKWPVDVTLAIAERLLDTIYNAIKIASPAKCKSNRFNTGEQVQKGFWKDTPNWRGSSRYLRS